MLQINPLCHADFYPGKYVTEKHPFAREKLYTSRSAFYCWAINYTRANERCKHAVIRLWTNRDSTGWNLFACGMALWNYYHNGKIYIRAVSFTSALQERCKWRKTNRLFICESPLTCTHCRPGLGWRKEQWQVDWSCNMGGMHKHSCRLLQGSFFFLAKHSFIWER